ncbi:N-terminal domain of ribose phosphate pyrophosphokinase [seawater metagenome]|uniref:ribose-phosphate diphosphokinase n=1 Tax=seawater metagenome TaxID=1561972 RepID=A0A5E8CL87_9ZZZZ
MFLSYNLISHSYSINDMVIFVGNGNRDFGLKVAKYFPGCLSNCIINRFSDGEIRIPPIQENIRKKDCILIQSVSCSTQGSVNDILMEMFVLIDALRRASASSITVVLPIFPYQRQDRKSYSRSPISSRMIATFLETQGVSRVIAFDLHASQIQGFFDRVPFDNLYCEPYFIEYIKRNLDLENLIIISPDEGGVKRASRVAKELNCKIGLIHKERDTENQIDTMVLMGDVNNACCFIIDDMIDTGGTACKAANLLKSQGATQIYFGACHGVLSGKAIDNINSSYFEKVIISNTIEIEERFGDNSKIDVLDVSEMCASAIYKSLKGESVSTMI